MGKEQLANRRGLLETWNNGQAAKQPIRAMFAVVRKSSGVSQTTMKAERPGAPDATIANQSASAGFTPAHSWADCHAVRWATRYTGRRPFHAPRWTRWHASRDGCKTLCGLVIIIATEAAFTPDTDDEMSRVDCPRCTRILNPRNADISRRAGDDATAAERTR